MPPWRTGMHNYFNCLMSFLTCALLRPRVCDRSSLSAGERYFWYRNRFSSSKIWWLVKAVLLFRFFFGGWRLLKIFEASAGKQEKNVNKKLLHQKCKDNDKNRFIWNVYKCKCKSNNSAMILLLRNWKD